MNADQLHYIAAVAGSEYQNIVGDDRSRLAMAAAHVTDLLSELAERTQERDNAIGAMRSASAWTSVTIRRGPFGRRLIMHITEDEWTRYLAHVARVRHLFPELAEQRLL